MLVSFFLFVDFEDFPGLFFKSFVFFEADPDDDKEDEDEEDDDGGRDAEVLVFAVGLILKVEGKLLLNFTRENGIRLKRL